MTPDPNSPCFIRHEVSEYAPASSKELASMFSRLKSEALKNRLYGVNADNIALTYNFYDSRTQIIVNHVDNYGNGHHFTLELVPDNGFGEGDDSLRCLYQFDANNVESSALEIKSFAKYIQCKMESFPELADDDRGLNFDIELGHAYKGFVDLIDTVLSNIKPPQWFNPTTVNLTEWEDVSLGLDYLLHKVKEEASSGRWNGLNPQNFVRWFTKRGPSVCLTYKAPEVWNIVMTIHYADEKLHCGVDVSLLEDFSKPINTQLTALANTFLSTLTPLCRNIQTNSDGFNYLLIDCDYSAALGTYCKMLDIIIPAIQQYEFQLTLDPSALSEEVKTLKAKLEQSLRTEFSVSTEEMTALNQRLNQAAFLPTSPLIASDF